MASPVRDFYPACIPNPPEWDALDFDNTTDLSVAADQTPYVQAAVDDCASSGRGGTVWLPSGVVRINDLVIPAGGITLRGAGWEEYPGAYQTNSPAKRGQRGTYLLTNDVSVPAITIAAEANNARICDFAFLQTHAPDVGDWTPTAFMPCVLMNGPNSGAFVAEHLLFWGCYQGIALGTVGNSVGRITLRDIASACYDTGIVATSVSGFLAITNMHVTADLLEGSSGMLDYIQQHSTGVAFYAVTKPSLSGFTAKRHYAGIQFFENADGGAQRSKISDVDFEKCHYGIRAANSTNAIIKVNNITFEGAGLGTDAPSMVFYISGSGGIVDINGLYGTNFESSAIWIDGTAMDVHLGDNIWIDNWNTAPTVAGNFNPAPAVYGVDPSSTITSEAPGRFTNSNGGNNFALDAIFLPNDDWLEYVPVLGAGSGTFDDAVVDGMYHIVDNLTCFFAAHIVVTTNGSAADYITVTLPFPVGVGILFVASHYTSFFSCTVLIDQSGPESVVRIYKYDATYPGGDGADIGVAGIFKMIP